MGVFPEPRDGSGEDTGNQDTDPAMPIERRRILFSDDEVVAAAVSHCRATGIAVPDAEVEDVDVCLTPGCAVTLTFAVSSPDQADELSIDTDTLVSALISFCRLNAIPLPKAPHKHIEPKDGLLSMVFNTDRLRGSVQCIAAA